MKKIPFARNQAGAVFNLDRSALVGVVVLRTSWYSMMVDLMGVEMSVFKAGKFWFRCAFRSSMIVGARCWVAVTITHLSKRHYIPETTQPPKPEEIPLKRDHKPRRKARISGSETLWRSERSFEAAIMKFGRGGSRLLEPVQRPKLEFLRKATSRWMPRLRGGRKDKYSTLDDDGCYEKEIVFDVTAEMTEPSSKSTTELFSPSCWNELDFGDSFDNQGLPVHQSRTSSTSKFSGTTASTFCSSDDGDVSTMEGSISGDDEYNGLNNLDEDDVSSIVLTRSSPSRRSIVRFADEVDGMGELEKVHEFSCWCVEQPDSWIPLHRTHGTVEHC